MSNIQKQLKNTLNQGESVILIELPEEDYFSASIESIKELTDREFKGVYVSIQRPFENLRSLLTENGIDTDNFLFIDVATAAMVGEQDRSEGMLSEDENCVHISPELDIDELVHAIYRSLDKIDAPKKFVFIDSLTTIALYKPLSEILRFSEFLMRTVKKHEADQLILVLNVAEALTQRKFIQDIAIQVDEILSDQDPA